ncbi:MAG: cardiolipin synthase [Micrococcales bacterium]|nr:cardiolipin synthase [Micrococcales bacterium]
MIILIVVAVALLVGLAFRIAALRVIPRNRRPQTAKAWLLAIFFIPFLGSLAFLIFGSHRLPRKRRPKQREISDYILETTEGIDLVTRDDTWPPWFGQVVELNRTLGAMPLVGGNRAEMWADDDVSLAEMTAAVRAAARLIHCEFYILSLDESTADFFDALEEAIQRGVTVRVLLDHLGNVPYPGFRRTTRRLTRMGADWHLMLPVQPLRGRYQRPDLRNHRKLLVIDGRIAFTGSQNVIETGYQRRRNHRRGLHWKDYMARFEGPIVAGIDALFVTDWYAETDELLEREVPSALEQRNKGGMDCQVVPSGPGFPGENNLRLFNALVYAARQRIVLVSPYFVPDDSMLYAITTAAQSGIDVQLFVSEVGDQFFAFHAQRSYYEVLLKAGVRIFLYAAPTILHAKHMSFDDDVSVIGSSNMDMRSFTLDAEISIMVRDRDFLRRLRELEDSYRESSRELTLETWMNRPLIRKMLDNMARLTAALQ